MFDFLNLFAAVVTAVAGITLYGEDIAEYPPPLGTPAAIRLHREWWRNDSECKYYGMYMVYERTWDIVKPTHVDGVVNTLVAEPGKPAGVAYLINRKQCPGQELKAELRVGTLPRQARRMSVGETQVPYYPVAEMKKEELPLWLPQMLAGIKRESEAGNPAALEFIKTSEDLGLVLKDLE